MKTKIKQTRYSLFYYFSFNKEILLDALLIILIGVFLLPQFAFSSEINKDTIINLSNQVRANLDLSALKENYSLDQAAMEKAKYIMVTGQFQHNFGDIKFSDWVKKQNYKYSYVGENLAIDFVSSEGVIEAWKKSPLHYKNIINSEFKDIGVAVLNGKFENEFTTLVVQIFGTPSEFSQAQPNQEKQSGIVLTAALSNKYLNNNAHNDQSKNNLNKTNLVLTENNFDKNSLRLDIDLNNLVNQKNDQVFNNIIIDFNIFNSNTFYFYLSFLIITLLLFLYYAFAIRSLINIQNYVQ
jgi:hypothetical protein